MSILSSRKSPKFAMELTIMELTNIPKVSGTTYISWKIKNGSLQGSTEKSHIRHYKSTWNYSALETMRISVDSKGQLNDRFIKFKVYTQNHSHHGIHNLHGMSPISIENSEATPIQSRRHRSSSSLGSKYSISKTSGDKTLVISSSSVDMDTSYVGSLKINLSEFANFTDGPVSRRYLLEDCKINCILNVQISLKLVSGDPNSFVAPPVKYRGLSSMLGSSENQSSMPGGSQFGADSNIHDQSATTSGSYYYKKLLIHSDPILLKLYQNSFQISWDERPGEFSPHECVDDIFHGSDGWAKNEEGQRLIDLNKTTGYPERERYTRRISLDRKSSAYSTNGSTHSGSYGRDRERSCISGSVSEYEVRGEMKSWHVSHIRD